MDASDNKGNGPIAHPMERALFCAAPTLFEEAHEVIAALRARGMRATQVGAPVGDGTVGAELIDVMYVAISMFALLPELERDASVRAWLHKREVRKRPIGPFETTFAERLTQLNLTAERRAELAETMYERWLHRYHGGDVAAGASDAP